MVRSIELLNGGTTIVDDDDYQAVCHFPWRRSSKGYVIIPTRRTASAMRCISIAIWPNRGTVKWSIISIMTP